MDSSYEILGLHPTKCTIQDVTRAYRKLALQNHPDKIGPRGVETMKAINAARDAILENLSSQPPEVEETQQQYNSDSEDTDKDTDEYPRPQTPKPDQQRSASDPGTKNHTNDDDEDEDEYVHVDTPPKQSAKPQSEPPTTEIEIDWSVPCEFYTNMFERLNKISSERMYCVHRRLNYICRFDRWQGQHAYLLWRRFQTQLKTAFDILSFDCYYWGPSTRFCNHLAQMLLSMRQLYALGGWNLDDARVIDKACDLTFMLRFAGIRESNRESNGPKSFLDELTQKMSGLFTRKTIDGVGREDADLGNLEPWLSKCYFMVQKQWDIEVAEWSIEGFWEFAGYDRIINEVKLDRSTRMVDICVCVHSTECRCYANSWGKSRRDVEY